MSARRQIIAALSEDRGGIATLYDVAGAQQLADAHQTEVRREDAALIENAACDADWSATPAYCQGLHAGAELLLAKTTEKATPALTIYRASYDSIVMGIYATREAAMDHVHAILANEEGGDVKARVMWRADDPEADEPEWECWLFDTDMDDDKPTGYVVTPLKVASAYDPEDDE